MDQQVICLITIHGIGFQHLPDDRRGIAGYADRLHTGLSQYLGAALGGDPRRTQGPIYIQSYGPPGASRSAPDPNRLGIWTSLETRTIDSTEAPLTDQGQPIAHVALAYWPLEDEGSHLLAVADTGLRALLAHSHYATLLGAAHMLFKDAAAVFEAHAPPAGTSSPSLSAQGTQGGLLATLHQLEDDVATYVCRNDLRERVRGFVRDVLLRLISRSDVAGVIVNAHSQGTVIAFDVLRELPPFAAPKVRGFLTAGSPLRKYTDLFCWGNDVGLIHTMGGWSNFWDPSDPVADPLGPQVWRPGSEGLSAQDTGTLYQWVDPLTGHATPFSIADQEVSNVANSAGGGLQAHNYWDNVPEVVHPLATCLQKGLEDSPPPD